MALNRPSYGTKLYGAVLLLTWVLALCSIIFQYQREKEYKAERLDTTLQIYNIELLDAMRSGLPPAQALAAVHPPLPDLRVTVLNSAGDVLYDTALADTLAAANHASRPEVARALADGRGYDVLRRSALTADEYFYSAMAQGDTVVRTAAPYTLTLRELLRADRRSLWFVILVAIGVSIGGYLFTHRLAKTMRRLNNFARRAEAGEPIYADMSFPADDLGDIARHIVSLYAARERAYAGTLAREREKEQMKRRLTNNINHELKTPVAAIRLCLETLAERPGLNDMQRTTIVERCLDNTLRLQTLLDDVATLTRLDDGTAQIAVGAVSLRQIIERTVAEQDTAGTLPVTLQLRDDMVMTGNDRLLASLFANLLRNANAYSEGTRIVIRQTGALSLTFTDNGKGVADEHLPHLFERFYRVDKGRSRDNGGTGLGLAIVKNAAAFHGGSVTVRNRPGGGLEFHISFGS